MIEISLTQFMSFISAQDSKQVGIVELIQKQKSEKYDPAKDFYKKFEKKLSNSRIIQLIMEIYLTLKIGRLIQRRLLPIKPLQIHI